MHKFSYIERKSNFYISYYYTKKYARKLLRLIGVNNMQSLTAIYEKADEGGYVCWIEEIPEAMSQGETLEEAKSNLLDALKLVIENNREQAEIAIDGKNVIKEKIPLSLIFI